MSFSVVMLMTFFINIVNHSFYSGKQDQIS